MYLLQNSLDQHSGRNIWTCRPGFNIVQTKIQYGNNIGQRSCKRKYSSARKFKSALNRGIFALSKYSWTSDNVNELIVRRKKLFLLKEMFEKSQCEYEILCT